MPSYLSAFLALLAVTAAPFAVQAAEPESATIEFKDSVGRDAARGYIHLSPDPNGEDERLPGILALPNAGESAADFLQRYGWFHTAPEARVVFIVLEATPVDQSIPGHRLRNPWKWRAALDLPYIEAMATAAKERHGIDPKRLYLLGFGQGASMAQQAYLEMSDRITGLAAIGGALRSSGIVQRPGPVYLLFGTDDPFNPVKGGASRSPFGEPRISPPIAHTVTSWVTGLGCTDPVPAITEDGNVERKVWSRCAPGGAVQAIMVDGLGHVWPGTGKSWLTERVAGPPNDAVYAPWDIWNFFEAERQRVQAQ